MARRNQAKNKPRRQYSGEFKAEVLVLAERVGVAAAARQLGLHESQLYGWRLVSGHSGPFFRAV